MQYAMLDGHPYECDSDDVLFSVYAERKGVDANAAARADYFSKGQPCFRASPLTKQFGWSVHSDECGRIALVAVGSDEHTRLVADDAVTKIRAMRNARTR